jgi:hypothetical protein
MENQGEEGQRVDVVDLFSLCFYRSICIDVSQSDSDAAVLVVISTGPWSTVSRIIWI